MGKVSGRASLTLWKKWYFCHLLVLGIIHLWIIWLRDLWELWRIYRPSIRLQLNKTSCSTNSKKQEGVQGYAFFIGLGIQIPSIKCSAGNTWWICELKNTRKDLKENQTMSCLWGEIVRLFGNADSRIIDKEKEEETGLGSTVAGPSLPWRLNMLEALRSTRLSTLYLFVWLLGIMATVLPYSTGNKYVLLMLMNEGQILNLILNLSLKLATVQVGYKQEKLLI